MYDRITRHGLRIDERLYNLVQHEIAPGTGIDPDSFWHSLSRLVHDLAPLNRQLLERRNELQYLIDEWYRQGHVPAEQREFLAEIGYLESPVDDVTVTTTRVDPEIAQVAGPQLVVPVDNARYALNAANARWGSLYDALYGTDVIPETEDRAREDTYNPIRGQAVVTWGEQFLDKIFPWRDGSHRDIHIYRVTQDNGLWYLEGVSTSGDVTVLANPDQYQGHVLTDDHLSTLLLRHHNLHVELQFDRDHPVGQLHPAGLKDIILEAAVTTIQDMEDSVAAVDIEDKVRVYRNWTGIMKGALEATFEKHGRTMTRRLNVDRHYTAPDGSPLTLPGRSLLLVRNVGLHMYTDSVTTATGQAIPEGFLDLMITCLAALHDLKRTGTVQNSRTGSIYVVKPKLHGSVEVGATVDLCARVEQALGLETNTIKLGIMDEERRTTLNLSNTIAATRERLVFINTGFLDRTGDEIHTAMYAGAMLPKAQIREQPWLSAYENRNVDLGLQAGLAGRAQIGKGMWTMPDKMAAMLGTKQSHPAAGATTAWVPSPTAATLHALHYHLVDVAQVQQELATRAPAALDSILTPPLMTEDLSPTAIRQELDNNVQSILGYVVHWINDGVGCSKVPDINGIGLMEDRATLRISSQHIANWLYHGIIHPDQVHTTFARMAAVVDAQNADTPGYTPMSVNLEDSQAYQAALELVFQGTALPNGYTEPILHARRRAMKNLQALSQDQR